MTQKRFRLANYKAFCKVLLQHDLSLLQALSIWIGKPNLSPFSFFNIFSANTPILVFSPARRVRDNTISHALLNCEAIKEVDINIVNYDMVQQMSLSSTEYEDGINEFEKSGLTQIKSEVVKPFRVAESPVQLSVK